MVAPQDLAARDKRGTYSPQSRRRSCHTVGGCRSSTSPFRADAACVDVSGGRCATRVCGDSSVARLRAATAVGRQAPGRFDAVPSAMVGASRSPRPGLHSSTRAALVRSSPRGRSAAGATSRASPQSSSPRRPKPLVDAIAFVPGDRDRRLKRGHAPAEALASELAAAWAIPSPRGVATRPGIDRQRDLPSAARRGNVARAFSAHGHSPAKVCLIDDVYTTGSTATACATELRRVGARHVEVVSHPRRQMSPIIAAYRSSRSVSAGETIAPNAAASRAKRSAASGSASGPSNRKQLGRAGRRGARAAVRATPRDGARRPRRGRTRAR